LTKEAMDRQTDFSGSITAAHTHTHTHSLVVVTIGAKMGSCVLFLQGPKAYREKDEYVD